MKSMQITQIALNKLKPDPANVRAAFTQESVRDLAASIKARGILVPLSVRKNGKGFIIKMGHRRAQAAKAAGLKSVPCIVVPDDGNAVDRGIDQVLENTARADLAPMDMARWLARLKSAEKLSPNEIAARLAGAGMKAMTRAQVDDLVRLVDLPGWAQLMVDAGELEASAAGLLLKIIAYPKGLKEAEKSLRTAVRWSGKAVAKDVGRALDAGFSAIGTDLTRTSEWERTPVHFNWKTRCKGCANLAQHGGSAWCLSRKEFEEHQQEAKDAGLLPGGKRPAKEIQRTADGRLASDEQLQAEKAQARERTLGEKARDYLHAYLARKLMEYAGASCGLQQRLVVWAALKKPGALGGRGAPGVWFGGEAGARANEAAQIHGLEDLLAGDGTRDDEARALAAQEIVSELPWRETQVLARDVFGDDLTQVWALDHEFLDLFRKRELAHLATQADLAVPDGKRTWLDSMKVDVMKLAIREQAAVLGVPPILRDLYSAAPEKPYGRGSSARDYDDTVCVGCGCTFDDPCDEGCGWRVQEDGLGVCDAEACAPHLERWQSGDRELSEQAKERIAAREEWSEPEAGLDDLVQ